MKLATLIDWSPFDGAPWRPFWVGFWNGMWRGWASLGWGIPLSAWFAGNPVWGVTALTAIYVFGLWFIRRDN
ncbi:hypothetical protein EBZ80_21450 [bacterium]|nr:hypothetical protein [Betaproteobacteria bacterium]NDE17490.1 hypothetical protein [bacterium]